MMKNEQQVEALASAVAARLGYAGKEVLTSREAANYMGVSLSCLYKMTMARRVPHYKSGKLCYFNRSELEGWLMRGRVASDTELTARAQSYCMQKGGARC